MLETIKHYVRHRPLLVGNFITIIVLLVSVFLLNNSDNSQDEKINNLEKNICVILKEKDNPCIDQTRGNVSKNVDVKNPTDSTGQPGLAPTQNQDGKENENEVGYDSKGNTDTSGQNP